MSQTPLRFVPLGLLLGDHEGLSSLAIPNALSTGTRNVTLDQYGRLRTIDDAEGTVAEHEGPTDPVALTAVFQYIKHNDDGSTTRQLLGVFENTQPAFLSITIQLSEDEGETWTALTGHLGDVAVGSIPTFTQVGNVVIVTSPYFDPVRWDGTTWAFAGDPSPMAAPTVVAAAGGGQLRGEYVWRVRAIRSDGTYLAASPVSARLTLEKGAATVTWIAETSALVTGYAIYRTTGSGATFFLEGVAQPATVVSFTARISDSELIRNAALERHGGTPPRAIATCMHKGRLLYIGGLTTPRRVYFADAGYPESVDANAFLDCTDGESASDRNLGVVGDFRGLAVVFQERAIWTIDGDGQVQGVVTNWRRDRSNAEIGTVAIQAVTKVPAGAKFFDADGTLQTTSAATLAYLTPLKDLRLFDGTDSIIISTAKQMALGQLTYALRRQAHVVHDHRRGEITWVFASGTDLTPAHAVTWHYRTGAMTERAGRPWAIRCAIEIDSPLRSGVYLLAGVDPTYDSTLPSPAMRLWLRSTPYLGIGWSLTTKPLYGAGSQNDRSGLTSEALWSYEKRWRWVDILCVEPIPEPFTVTVLAAEIDDVLATVTVQPATADAIPLTPGSGDRRQARIESSDGSGLVAADGITPIRVTLQDAYGRYPHARGIRLRLSGTRHQSPLTLIGLMVAYQLLTGMKRPTVR